MWYVSGCGRVGCVGGSKQGFAGEEAIETRHIVSSRCSLPIGKQGFAGEEAIETSSRSR